MTTIWLHIAKATGCINEAPHSYGSICATPEDRTGELRGERIRFLYNHRPRCFFCALLHWRISSRTSREWRTYSYCCELRRWWLFGYTHLKTIMAICGGIDFSPGEKGKLRHLNHSISMRRNHHALQILSPLDGGNAQLAYCLRLLLSY